MQFDSMDAYKMYKKDDWVPVTHQHSCVQEVAAVALSRWAAFAADSMDAYDMNKWVDSQLISLTAEYCSFRKDDEASLRLEPEFEMYPELMFHLRRSAFLDVFNNTPDETAYYRLLLSRCATLPTIAV